MPFKNVPQPEILQLTDGLRLRKYDGNYESFLNAYRDPYIYQNSEGIFDEDDIPDMGYVKGMCEYLDGAGELYYIETLKNGEYIIIGDVTVKDENPPIAIWYGEYRGIGVGRTVMKAVISRLSQLGYKSISGSVVYKWNTPSQKLHERLGFQKTGENEDEYIYSLALDEAEQCGLQA